ncbi:inorganic phosphate transporter [Halomarina litorea]|uniref:inorganic phosphate transporter n=1 Tax=Halomarina litorea TaxID=2961595 RepID=UPI0020C570D9|nr:inorganic phosphate transporter [Halomarina sp. BCD28]
MVEALLIVGLAVAVFVGFNIGGSSTGVAFGPAVGSNTLSKLAAAALMSGFALLGGWTVGRNVIATMGGEIVPQSQFTLAASVTVLFFVGVALLISNLFGVPASTSMTAVGAIAGLGVATDTIMWETMGRIVSWWLVSPILAFWICAVVGRYLYPYLDAWFALDRSDDPAWYLDRSGPIPIPRPTPGVRRREVVGTVLVIAIACYMAFSAGASNVANAVAPLVGAGAVPGVAMFGSTDVAILIGGGAIGLGAFTIARRTLDTVGNDLTDLPLLAALVVETISASLITFLSVIGIPASLAVSATMCIVGLGWGRATRTTKLSQLPDAAKGAMAGEKAGPGVTIDALAADGKGGATDVRDVPSIGEEDPAALTAGDLFDPAATARVVVLWVVTPTVAAVAAYLVFRFVPFV